MSRKPEGVFTAAVHRHLPPALYRMKNHNPYVAGVPDVWYSGPRSDLWVEYKFLARVPVKADIKVECTALQLDWLRGRYEEGRNVAVIVGCKEGGVILKNRFWEKLIANNSFREQLSSRAEIARWIVDTVGEPNDQVRCRNLQGARTAPSRDG